MSKSIFGYLEGGASDEHLKVKRNLAKHEEWTEAILPADADAESPEGETNRRPLVIFGIVVVLALVVLAGRLFVLQVLAGNENLALLTATRFA